MVGIHYMELKAIKALEDELNRIRITRIHYMELKVKEGLKIFG